jgi:hypothetical protein
MAGLALLALGAVSIPAQNSSVATNSPNPAEPAAPSPASQVKLSDGVRDILNLSAAHVSEDTIVAFIGGSAVTYNLNASDIIYLRQQDVSDRVITTMLNHRKEVAEANARIAARLQAEAMTSSLRASAQDTQPETTVVQTAPAAAAPSTVYVVPSSPPPVYYDYYDYYPYYSYYPYYRGYYGFSYPAWSFSFGFGSGYRGGGFHHGGFNGGGPPTGGSHGGGSPGGGAHGGGPPGGGAHGGGSHGGGHR